LMNNYVDNGNTHSFLYDMYPFFETLPSLTCHNMLRDIKIKPLNRITNTFKKCNKTEHDP